MVRTITRSPWTVEDRALMLAYRQHRDGIHDRCGQPKAKAWHWDNEGEYEASKVPTICWACTAMDRAEKADAPVHVLHHVEYVRDETRNPLPPLELPGPDRPRPDDRW